MKSFRFFIFSAFIHAALFGSVFYFYNKNKKQVFSKTNEVIFVLKKSLYNSTPVHNVLNSNSLSKVTKSKNLVSRLTYVKNEKSDRLKENNNSQNHQSDSQYKDRITLSKGILIDLLSKNLVPRYPRSARARKNEGQVVVRAILDDKTIQYGGPAKSVVLHKSSGHSILDESALSAIKEWVFPKESLIQLNSVTGKKSLLIPIRFALKKGTSSVENN